MWGKYATLTNPIHKNTYAAIDPLRPELSQAGRTVVITGGNSGVGYGIAQAFIRASAAKVIILGRRKEVVASAAQRLADEAGPSYEGKVLGMTCDIYDAASVDALWAKLRDDSIVADVLVLNAAMFAAKKTLLELGTEGVWENFNANVRSQLQMTERFYKQEGKGASDTKNLVNVSTASLHEFVRITRDRLGYGLTKNACHLMLQLIAMDNPPEKLQIISYHPGAIFTEAAKSVGWKEDSLPWDHVDLPGHFAVWAASPEASFLHGRFVWASWDVDQLKNGELRKQIDEDSQFLRVGVIGL